MRDTGRPAEGHAPPLPEIDPTRLSDAMRRVLVKPKPPQGWPGKPPKEVRADDDEEEAGDGT